VIAPSDGPVDLAALTSVGRSWGFQVNGSIAPMAPGPIAATRTARTLRRGDFDVVHLHEPLAPSITLAALATHDGPLVGTFHAAGDRTPYRWFARPLSRLAARLTTRVAVSAAAHSLARRYLGGTYELIPNGIDLCDEEPADHARPPQPQRRAILFVGRHDVRKGLPVLLDAMTLLPSDVSLWVAGDGPEQARLRARSLADDRVMWLGRISDDEKRQRLRAASVLCAPSLHGESFGMVVLEAMAAGTPVVASDVEGYRHVTCEGTTALLAPSGDSHALARALRRVLDDHELATVLRERGRRRADDFSLTRVAERYASVYEQAVRSLSRT
jgi:phosphatidylinositol alpha-mannosyltransferase